MTDRRAADPKILLSVAAAVLVGSSAIAIAIAAGCSPDSSSGGVTTSSTAPVR